MRIFGSISCVVGLAVLLVPVAFGEQPAVKAGGIEVAYETIGSLVVEDALGGESGVVLVGLGDGFEVVLKPMRVENTAIDTRVVSGRLARAGMAGEDSGLGWFVVAFADDGIEGALWARDGVWTIRGGGLEEGGGRSGVLFMPTEHDGEDCSGVFVPGVGGAEIDFEQVDAAGREAAGQDAADRVRVLVLYDAVAEGSVGSMSAYVSAMVGSANFAYINSGVDPLFLEIAGIELIDVPVTNDDGLILRQLTDRYDLVSDEAHALRDAYDADLVAQLVDIPSFCGRAWLSPDNALFGFSVSDTDCALSNLTFAHELGHNFGCAHDPDNAGSSYVSYGYGHRWNSNQWRSVMAYSPGSRVPQFSNPSVSYDGGVTGIENQRDNARLLNLTDQVVANNRVGDGSGVDCDGNLRPDRLDIALDPGLDLDEDGQIDACQILADPSLDCDEDGMLDEEQVRPRVHELVGTASPFGTGIVVTMGTGALPVPESEVIVSIMATGDLGSGSEFVSLNFNDGLLEFDSFVSGGVDCYSPGLLTTVPVSREVFEPIALAGVDLRITSSAAVGSAVCTNTVLSVVVDYRRGNLVDDTDNNGVLDQCQSVCEHDLNGDGALDFFDVSAFLTAFGAMDPVADFDGNGEFDFFDVSAFLMAFAKGCP